MTNRIHFLPLPTLPSFPFGKCHLTFPTACRTATYAVSTNNTALQKNQKREALLAARPSTFDLRPGHRAYGFCSRRSNFGLLTSDSARRIHFPPRFPHFPLGSATETSQAPITSQLTPSSPRKTSLQKNKKGKRRWLADLRPSTFDLRPHALSYRTAFGRGSGLSPTSGLMFSRSQMLRKRTGLPWNWIWSDSRSA